MVIRLGPANALAMFEGNDGVDFYRILGVAQRASSAEIKAAFRQLAKVLHPDCNAGDRAAVTLFTAVHHAYTVLLNAQSRAAYDGYLERVRVRAEAEAAEARVPGHWSLWREVVTTTATTIVLTACLTAGISIWQWSHRPPHDQALRPGPQAADPGVASAKSFAPPAISREELVELLFGNEMGRQTGEAAYSATMPTAAKQPSSPSTGSDIPTSTIDPAPVNSVGPPPHGMDQNARMQAERLVDRGERYLADGNIAVSRLYFARAAELGLAAAATRLAETFEPDALARHGVHGVRPDPNEAAKWRKRALELGSETAATSAGLP